MKQIAHLISDHDQDGRGKKTITVAFWKESEQIAAFEQDRNKAYRTLESIVVDPEEHRKKALAKLDGLDKLLLGITGEPSERQLLAECAEFLNGIGIVSPAFDKQVKALIERIRDKAPMVKQYMSHCADKLDVNETAKPFDEWAKTPD